MFKRYMVLSEVWGEVDCRMFDSFDAAMNHKLAAEFGVYEFLCE